MAGNAPAVSTGEMNFGEISNNRGVVLGAASGHAQVIGSQTNYNIQYPDIQLSFFKTSNYESYKNINPKRVSGTCAWFLEHQKFQSWKASDGDNLLWLSADPGCGKSVLSRALIDEKLVGAESTTLCHFFFKDNDEQDNVTTALCALLHQFFCAHENLLKRHAALAAKKCGQTLRNEFEELWHVLISAARDPSAGYVICILDALDECRQPDRDKLIVQLESFYSSALGTLKLESKLKFLVTSRPYDEIERRFRILTRQVPTIRLAGEEESGKISREIGAVIEAKVKEIAEELDLDEDVQSSLHDRLCEIPNRTYLWLHLILDEIKNALGQTKKKLLKVVDTLPKTVEEAYEKILAKCKQKEAKRVLQIIVAAQRPLTLREIDVALEIVPDSTSYKSLDLEGLAKRKKWISKSCGLFVSIVDSRVYLIHQTAREFLIQQNNEISELQEWRHSIDLQKAHQVLSEICITLLLFRDFQEYHGIPINANESYLRGRSLAFHYLESYAFLNYSARHWIFHVQEAHNPIWVSKTAALCDIGNGLSCTWFRTYSMLTDPPYTRTRESTKQSALYWAAVFGLINETQFLLDGGINPNEQGGYFGNALQAAAYSGYKEIAKLLIDSGADINAKGGKYNSALQAACYWGQEAVLDILLTFSPFGSNKPVTVTAGAVKAAAGNTRNGKDIMTLLLNRRGSEVNITEEVVRIVVENKGNGKDIMTLLLNRQECKFKITEKVVAQIAKLFNKEVMMLLLNRRGSEVKITKEVVRAVAENRGNGKDIMALLLDQRGSEVKIIEEVVRVVAGNSENGKDIMTLLLDRRGSEVKITEEVVRAAAENRGNGKDIMTLLLDRRGSEVNITEEVVRAAAENRGNGKDIMALLLDRRGSEVNITEEVVRAAAGNWVSGKDIMALLLDRRGSEVKITEEVVKAAEKWGNGKDIMTLLLDRRGSEVKISEEAVAQIIKLYGKEVIMLLLNRRGSEIQITEEVVRAAAENKGNGKDIMTLLFNRLGSEVKITEEAVAQIAKLFDKEVMMLLLDRRGSEVYITGEVVKAAVENSGGGQKIIALLCERCPDMLLQSALITVPYRLEQLTQTLFRIQIGSRWEYGRTNTPTSHPPDRVTWRSRFKLLRHWQKTADSR
ncbi:uncharacterized protein K441DRAFT_613744 [Cenococcum geophilum 1.58]|uniref:uncharacterized protein n=1 Tax=Cenococcum geophilum 1.58 TaxID=794803 RepID=UPI00358E8D71|nr:hypothetical protein K441DRAFT_613744 [Cenococcum geophilum 1.58]